MNKNIYRGSILICALVLFSGCGAQKPKWMTAYNVDPSGFNHTLTNSDRAVLYAHEVEGSLQIDHVNADSSLSHTTSLPMDIDDSVGFFSLNNGTFYASGKTSDTVSFVDSSNESFWQGVTVAELEAGESFDIVGIFNHQNNLGLYGAIQEGGHDTEGLVVVFNADGEQVASYTDNSASRIKAVVTGTSGNLALQNASNEVITMDASLTELGRFELPSGSSLIALSIDHPMLSVSNGNAIQRVAANGTAKWTYDSPDIPTIKGQSMDGEGNIVIWGDEAVYNLFNMTTDFASFEKIGIDGTRQWLFQSENKLNLIKYANIDHRSNGETTLSYQGWKGELAGLLIGGSSAATPVRVTRTIQHDTISKFGERVTQRQEPSSTEVYAQCGLLCIGITSQTEGHCESLDVTYINQNIATISKVCGPDTADIVKLSYF